MSKSKNIRIKHHGKNRPVTETRVASNGAVAQGKLRLLCVGMFFFLCYGAICVRVVELTVFPPEAKDAGAVAQHSPRTVKEEGIPLMALIKRDEKVIRNVLKRLEEEVQQAEVVLPRKNIVDRNGLVVATSLETASLFADARDIRHPEQTARDLKKILPDIDYPTIKKRLASGKSFVWVRRNLTPREEEAVNMLGVPGLHFQKEYTRVYPQKELLSHVLGFVGVDNAGLAGIEKHFDKDLRDTEAHEPLQLSIDLRMQYLLHDQLMRTVSDFKAIGAAGIIAHVPTGEIRAMVSLPDFDPHYPARANADTLFNRASLGTYEMGSTFKTFTLAMALEYGTTKVQDGYDATNPIRISRFTINDSHPQARWLTVPEIFAYSSNIGTVRMAMDVGVKRQQEFLKDIGMLEQVDIELPERAKPLVPAQWGEVSMMTIAFGHGMSVTPLHLVQGIRTVIGDGHRAGLTLVKDKQVASGEEVVDQENVDHVRRLLQMVVQYGTGKQGNAAGYRVGGKTGTAEKVVGRSYAHKAMISSFLGAFPMDNPEYIVYVMVDEPKGNKNTYGYATGGWVAAPTVGRLISQIAPMLGIVPNYQPTPDEMDAFWVDTQKRVAENRGKLHAASYRSR